MESPDQGPHKNNGLQRLYKAPGVFFLFRLRFLLSAPVPGVLYTYAMAINSVSTDPLLAVYPVFVMLGGRAFMKEKVSKAQYVFLLGIIAGSILVVMDTIS